MPSSGTGSQGAFSALPEDEKGASKGEPAASWLTGQTEGPTTAGPQKSAGILISLAPVIAGLHFFSLVPISWLRGEQEGRSLDGHSAALASGQPQAGQTSAPASKHQQVCFHHFHPYLSYCPFKILQCCFLHLKINVMLSKR